MKKSIQRLYQIISSLLSIQQGSSSFLALKDGGLKLRMIQREIKVESKFQSVLVEGDVSMILTNEFPGTIRIEGHEKDVNRVNCIVKNNQLIIDAERKESINKLTICLSAAMLHSIRINGDTDVSSAGVIQSGDLHISLNGNITIKVKSTGNISFDTPSYFDLLWKGAPLMQKKKNAYP